jgi:dTDP-4-dehydrorhamnose 3,5-epimerase
VRVVAGGLPGILILEPQVFNDSRGFFLEVYRADRLEAAGIHNRFVQANHSRSAKNSLRGLHWQWRRPQAKLVRVVDGTILDVVVDVRRQSPTFARWWGVELRAEAFQHLYVPAGFAHGFYVISEYADVEYFCSDYYDPGGEAGLPWNDPTVGIDWPTNEPLLSPKDAQHPPLQAHRQDLLP